MHLWGPDIPVYTRNSSVFDDKTLETIFYFRNLMADFDRFPQYFVDKKGTKYSTKAILIMIIKLFKK